MTALQPPGPANDPEFVGVIHLRRPPKGTDPAVFRRFDWASGDVNVTGDVSRAEGSLVVARAEIRTAASGGITHAVLRSVPLGEVLMEARREAELEHDALPLIEPDYELPPGRVAITDDLLRNVSLALLDETRPGRDRQANRRLAEKFERPEGTVRTWVARARQEGWLAPGVSGRMDAQAGPKLLRWLGEQLNSDKAVGREARIIAGALGAADPGAVAERAMRVYRSQAELEYPSQLDIGPLLLNVTAQVLFGRSIGAELGARVEAGQNEKDALKDIATEVRAKLAEHDQ